jgi:hypothetical protein
MDRSLIAFPWRKSHHPHILVLGENFQMLQPVLHGILPKYGWAIEHDERQS